MMAHRLSPLLLSSSLVTVLLAGPSAALAVEYAITVADDNDSTNGDCSLREALYAATNNVARDDCPAGSPTATDRITLYTSVTFDGGLFYMNSVQGGELVIRGSTSVPTDSVINLFWSDRFLYLLNGDPVTVKDLQILFGEGGAPRYGGIIRCAGTSLTLDNVQLGLSSAGYGGAVSFLTLAGSHWLRIVSSILSGNTVDGEYDSAGGALWVNVGGETEVTIVDSTISSSTLTTTGSPHGEGAGAWITADDTSRVVIAGSLFDDNSASIDDNGHGAGLLLDLEGSATAEIRDTIFSDNHWDHAVPTTTNTADGAEIWAHDDSSLVVERCSFTDNRSPNASYPDQLVVAVANNAAARVASILFTGGYRAVRATSSSTLDAYFTHLTVTENDLNVSLARFGTGLFELSNSIVSFNGHNLPNTSGGVTQSSNFIGDYPDPLFVDPGSGDYHLQETSPAIDNGNQSRSGLRFCDLDHGPRIVGSETDQGAYEWGALFADDYETGDTSAWQ